MCLSVLVPLGALQLTDRRVDTALYNTLDRPCLPPLSLVAGGSAKPFRVGRTEFSEHLLQCVCLLVEQGCAFFAVRV